MNRSVSIGGMGVANSLARYRRPPRVDLAITIYSVQESVMKKTSTKTAVLAGLVMTLGPAAAMAQSGASESDPPEIERRPSASQREMEEGAPMEQGDDDWGPMDHAGAISEGSSAGEASESGDRQARAGASRSQRMESYGGVSLDEQQRRDVQRELLTQNYYNGEIDGHIGRETRAALRRYQQAEGLEVTGQVNRETARALGLSMTDEMQPVSGESESAGAESGNPSSAREPGHSAEREQRQAQTPQPSRESAASDSDRSSAAASDTGRRARILARGPQVREAQRALSRDGFLDGEADGLLGPATQDAIRAFQRANRLEETGRLSWETLDAMGIETSGRDSSMNESARSSSRSSREDNAERQMAPERGMDPRDTTSPNQTQSPRAGVPGDQPNTVPGQPGMTGEPGVTGESGVTGEPGMTTGESGVRGEPGMTTGQSGMTGQSVNPGEDDPQREPSRSRSIRSRADLDDEQPVRPEPLGAGATNGAR